MTKESDKCAADDERREGNVVDNVEDNEKDSNESPQRGVRHNDQSLASARICRLSNKFGSNDDFHLQNKSPSSHYKLENYLCRTYLLFYIKIGVEKVKTGY